MEKEVFSKVFLVPLPGYNHSLMTKLSSLDIFLFYPNFSAVLYMVLGLLLTDTQYPVDIQLKKNYDKTKGLVQYKGILLLSY